MRRAKHVRLSLIPLVARTVPASLLTANVVDVSLTTVPAQVFRDAIVSPASANVAVMSDTSFATTPPMALRPDLYDPLPFGHGALYVDGAIGDFSLGHTVEFGSQQDYWRESLRTAVDVVRTDITPVKIIPITFIPFINFPVRITPTDIVHIDNPPVYVVPVDPIAATPPPSISPPPTISPPPPANNPAPTGTNAPASTTPETYLVTNADDAGAGSLRQAITDANAHPGADVINFDSAFFSTPQTIHLTGGSLFITDAVTINGGGQLTIDGAGAVSSVYGFEATGFRIVINSMEQDSHVTLKGLTITHFGHAVETSMYADVTIDSCLITDNTSEWGNGAGITVSSNSLTVVDSTITGNSAGGSGGAIYWFGNGANPHLTVSRSTISNNVAERNGGGISFGSNLGKTFVFSLSDSTISGNTATNGSGGGVSISGPNLDVTIQNCNVSSNVAGSFGGGIALNTAHGDVAIHGCTVTNNVSADGGGLGISEAYKWETDHPLQVDVTDTKFSGNTHSAVETPVTPTNPLPDASATDNGFATVSKPTGDQSDIVAYRVQDIGTTPFVFEHQHDSTDDTDDIHFRAEFSPEF